MYSYHSYQWMQNRLVSDHHFLVHNNLQLNLKEILGLLAVPHEQPGKK